MRLGRRKKSGTFRTLESSLPKQPSRKKRELTDEYEQVQLEAIIRVQLGSTQENRRTLVDFLVKIL